MKEIKGYEGLYSVTEDGRVYSHLRGGGYLKSGITKNGYARVALCGHKRKRYLVHRLVAQTFIPNPENKEKVMNFIQKIIKEENEFLNEDAAAQPKINTTGHNIVTCYFEGYCGYISIESYPIMSFKSVYDTELFARTG